MSRTHPRPPGRILHVLDHSIPLHSGYSFRTRAILEHQRALGWQTVHLTGPKQCGMDALVEEADGLRFHRTPPLAPRKEQPRRARAAPSRE